MSSIEKNKRPIPICVFSAPYGGAEYLSELLAPHAWVDAHGELFSADKCQLAKAGRKRRLEDLGRQFGEAIDSLDSSLLIETAKEFPRRFLESLFEATPRRICFFSIRRDQLEWSQIHNVLISDSRVRKIVLRRDPLVSMVLRLRGKKRASRPNIDESKMAVLVKPESLIRQANLTERWIQRILDTLVIERQRFAILDSDEDLCKFREPLACLNLFRQVLRKGLAVNLRPLEESELARLSGKLKPVGPASIANAISNFDELAEGLKVLGRSDLIDHHLPLAEPEPPATSDVQAQSKVS